jgi:uncharacterized protein (DUF2062 family)
MFKRWKNKVRHHFEDVWKLKNTPHSIALGFAIGTFLAVLPTPGFSILLGFLVILIFERVNKFSLMAAMAFWNPIILIPVYSLSYLIGDFFFGQLPVVEIRIRLLEQAYNLTRRFLIGNVILAIIFSIASYFIIKVIVQKIQSAK